MDSGIIVSIGISLITLIVGMYTNEIRTALDSYFGSRRVGKKQRQVVALERRISLIESLIDDPARLFAYVMPPVIITLMLLGLMVAIAVALVIGTFPGKSAAGLFVIAIFGLCIVLAKFSIDICEDVAHSERNLAALKTRLEKLR